MSATSIRPWRLALLFTGVLAFTAYLPHPQLGEPLPQTLRSLVRRWQDPPTTRQTADAADWAHGFQGAVRDWEAIADNAPATFQPALSD